MFYDRVLEYIKVCDAPNTAQRVFSAQLLPPSTGLCCRCGWEHGQAPELHALLQELFEWRARSRGRNFSLVCAGLGVAVDTTVSE